MSTFIHSFSISPDLKNLVFELISIDFDAKKSIGRYISTFILILLSKIFLTNSILFDSYIEFPIFPLLALINVLLIAPPIIMLST